MINVDEIFNGFVLDHIQAGRSMAIYHYLNLDELDCQVAIIKNARSGKMGRKDIIKVEGPLDIVDFDVLGFIDHNITVDIIKDGKLIENVSINNGKLAYTGNNVNVVLTTSVIAIIALAITVATKRNSNEK